MMRTQWLLAFALALPMGALFLRSGGQHDHHGRHGAAPSASGAQVLVTVNGHDITAADKCFPGPAGALNMAFHRNAIALVTRPLAIPNNAMGVLSHVGVYNDIAMRVSMQYSIAQGGTVVNLDILAGVAVLDTNLGVVLQG